MASAKSSTSYCLHDLYATADLLVSFVFTVDRQYEEEEEEEGSKGGSM